MSARTILKMLAPYVAVIVGLYVFENAWLSILLYHAQILTWRPQGWKRLFVGWNASVGIPALCVCALAGPLIYFLFSLILQSDGALASWLNTYGLSQGSFLVMVFYFGLLHPLLEQLHWDALRKRTPLSHLLFAGYHALVISAFLSWPWVLTCLVILHGVSVFWASTRKTFDGLIMPALTHIAADLGIAVAAYVFVY